MLKLKLQYLGSLIQRADSLEKTLMLGKIEGKRRRGQQRTRWLDGITDSIDMSEQTPGDCEGQGSLACWSPWGRKESDTTEQLNIIHCKAYSCDRTQEERTGSLSLVLYHLKENVPRITVKWILYYYSLILA